MSFNKGIEHKKEKRKPYMWAQNLWSRLVGTMGSCDYCKSNRLHKFKKDELAEPLFDLDTGFIGGLLADEITSRFQVAVKNAIERKQKNNQPS